jgi:hypothetical protein
LAYRRPAGNYTTDKIGYRISLAREASNDTHKPIAATSANENRRLDRSAIRPISGGPSRKPKKLIDDTAASAIPADIVVDLPAAPYTSGTTDDTPKPTSKKPTIAVAPSEKQQK